MARLQKFEDAGYKVISILGGCEFMKYLRENPGIGNEICLQPYVKNSHINIRDSLYGGITETTKIY